MYSHSFIQTLASTLIAQYKAQQKSLTLWVDHDKEDKETEIKRGRFEKFGNYLDKKLSSISWQAYKEAKKKSNLKLSQQIGHYYIHQDDANWSDDGWLEKPDCHGRTPLLLAIDMGNTILAKELILSGASINAKDFHGLNGQCN